ncbi:hypothetical protein A2U01_0003713 [Trifolium medium]|uniref:Uncharacterized protein n=1 Tax=Trifolium medium TaxID=97028 RepID=A0A392M662_9FABA|nr:hypothetical protein [Trifolium medium]
MKKTTNNMGGHKFKIQLPKKKKTTNTVAAFALQPDGDSLLSGFGFDIRLSLACGAQRSPPCRLLWLCFLVLQRGVSVGVWCSDFLFGLGAAVLVVVDATWFSVRAGLIVIVVMEFELDGRG